MTDPMTLDDAMAANWTATVKINADASQYKVETQKATALGQQMASTLTSAFTNIAIKGKSVSETLRGMALQLSNMVMTAAMKPLQSGLAGMFDGLLGGLAFAKGGAIQRGLPVPFAQGGVIQSPVTFPMAGGRMGLAGERGPEAIMPLSRGPDGRLGVAARANAGVNITFNVSATDAESFRRSETQVAAMLTRAVSLGQRNL